MNVKINQIGVNGPLCAQSGFSLSCVSFSLPPKSYHNITISFTPDFLSSIVNKDIYLETSEVIMPFSYLNKSSGN